MNGTRHFRLLASAALFATVATAMRGATTNASFVAYLTNGSLRGIQFPVLYSYDAAAITGGSEAYVPLLSFDFNLLSTHFSRTNIQQGGQVIFHYGALYNVTAEFYPSSDGPPGARFNNIAFGFGGPATIGYTDTNSQYGAGYFSLAPNNAPPQILIQLDGQMYAQLSFSGAPGATYVLRYTEDLAVNFASWTPLATNNLTDSNWFYIDMASPFSAKRFYRVEQISP